MQLASERLKTCTCWVRSRPEVEQFGLRWGAHSRSCPVYRVSLDPVDREQDCENRDYGEAHFGGGV